VSGPKPPDILRIVEALDRRSVEYLLVGGIAATAHGAERLTGDADTVVRRTTENLEATAAVLRDLNAHLLVEGLSDDEAPELPVQIDALTLSRMEISTWRTDAGDLDVLVEIPAQDGSRLSYDDLLPPGPSMLTTERVTSLSTSPRSRTSLRPNSGPIAPKITTRFQNYCDCVTPTDDPKNNRQR
jgi:hypothetical protein